jgi:hypothetical protein
MTKRMHAYSFIHMIIVYICYLKQPNIVTWYGLITKHRVRSNEQIAEFGSNCIANDGPVRIHYKCLFPIYLFP